MKLNKQIIYFCKLKLGKTILDAAMFDLIIFSLFHFQKWVVF